MPQPYLIAIYCLVDELLKAMGHKFDARAKISDSELITVAVVAALSYGGNWQKAFDFFISYHLILTTIHKSRISRRLRSLDSTIEKITHCIGDLFIDIATEKEFIADSAPLPVCDNIRIQRCKLLPGEDFRGYVASFRRYFYGLRMQLITTKQGVPVRAVFTEGAMADNTALELLPFDMSAESKVYMDAGYTDYHFEDSTKRKRAIELLVQRKKNAKRKRSREAELLIQRYRKRIECTISMIKAKMMRKIHAVTIETFILKARLFVLATQLQMIL